MDKKIPYRPSKAFKELTKQQCDCLSYYYFSNCKKEEAFKLFIKPSSELGEKAMRAISAKELFDSSIANKYLEALEQEVTVFLEPYKAKTGNEEERKVNRIKRIEAMKEKALGIVERNLDNPEVAMDAVKILCKEFIDDENDSINIPPQRYLPVSCNDCRYKVACHDNYVDECPACKYKIYANKEGISFAPEHQFDKDMLATLLPKEEETTQDLGDDDECGVEEEDNYEEDDR